MASRGQLMDSSPVPSAVADSETPRTTPVGPPFLDIAENNQAAEEALRIVEDMASQDRAKTSLQSPPWRITEGAPRMNK